MMPGASRQTRALSRTGSTQATYVRIAKIAAGIVWLEGGHAHAVLEARASGATSADPARQEAAVAARAAFLNGLDYPVQFVAQACPADLGGYAGRLERAGARLGDDPLGAIAWDHAAFARRLTRGGELMRHRCLVAVSAAGVATRPAAGVRCFPRLPPGGRGRPDHAAAEAAVARALDARCDEVARGLARCDVTARRLDDAALRDLFYEAWCPEQARVQPLPSITTGSAP